MSSRTAHAELAARPPVLRALARPRAVALACIAVLVAAGWAYLGLVVAGQTSQGILSALCQPIYGVPGSSSVTGLVLTFAMWCAMVLAMMLPTAAPMIMTYAELNEAAAAKGEPAASPLVLTAGYLVAWLGAALALSALQRALALGSLDGVMSAVNPFAAGALFLIAGLYQFSRFKHACLTQCQHPFRFFFANWTAEPRGVFQLGLRQGLYCLGCCWAMMLLMFAIGVMSVLWMAALGAVMAIEKLGTTMRFSRVVGMAWLAIGVAIIAEQVLWKAG
jgi:predicted metal-binding membrane protein